MSDDLRAACELQKEVNEALRARHPEWIDENGDCPTCESYQQRLAEILALFESDRAFRLA